MSFIEKAKRYIVDLLTPATPKSKTDLDDYPDGIDYRLLLDNLLRRKVEDVSKYEDYDLMDAEVPEMTAALNVIADYVVYPNSVDKAETVKIKAGKYQDKVDEIIKQLNFHNEFYSIVRETCKYGDNYEELVPNKAGKKLVLLKNIPVESVIVNVKNGIFNQDEYLRQVDDRNEDVATLSFKEVSHFSLATDRRRRVLFGKGVSVLEKSRLIYRQLRLMEEGCIIRRLSRSNQNFGYLVDVGSLEGDEALDYLDKYQRRIKRRKYVDPVTGKFTYKHNPLSTLEDVYIPTRQGSNANVVSLNTGSGSENKIEDLNYFQNKMIYSTNTPKVLIGKEEDLNSKSTSDIQFISFMRMIRRIQMVLEPAIIQLFKNALALEGILDVEIEIEWPVVGTIDEERKWRIELVKMQIASMLSQDMGLIDDYYIYKEFMNLTDDQIDELTTRMDETEEKYAAEVEDSFVDTEEEVFDGEAEPEGDGEPEDDPKTVAKKKESAMSVYENMMYEKVDKSGLNEAQKLFVRNIVKVVGMDETLKSKIWEIAELSKLRK